MSRAKHYPSTLSCRTPQNKIVIFEGDVDRLAGEIRDIRDGGIDGIYDVWDADAGGGVNGMADTIRRHP